MFNLKTFTSITSRGTGPHVRPLQKNPDDATDLVIKNTWIMYSHLTCFFLFVKVSKSMSILKNIMKHQILHNFFLVMFKSKIAEFWLISYEFPYWSRRFWFCLILNYISTDKFPIFTFVNNLLAPLTPLTHRTGFSLKSFFT